MGEQLMAFLKKYGAEILPLLQDIKGGAKGLGAGIAKHPVAAAGAGGTGLGYLMGSPSGEDEQQQKLAQLLAERGML